MITHILEGGVFRQEFSNDRKCGICWQSNTQLSRDFDQAFRFASVLS
jgi:hypothetical protein